MSNKTTPSGTESVESVTNTSLANLNRSASSSLKSSPLFGWLFAGSDLLSAKLDQAAGMVSKKIDDTHETIMSMQAKGAEVESELKRTLNPFALVDSAQKLVTENPLFNVLSGGQKKQQKAQQLEALNAKVDLLVEQIALLAAKQAAAKVEKSSQASNSNTTSKAAATKKPAATRRTAAKSTAAKSTQSKAATSTAKTTTAKSSTAKTTTKRKTSASAPAGKTTAAKRTTASTSKSSSPAKNSGQANEGQNEA